MFEPGMYKSAMIVVCLAVRELVRHHSVVPEQNDLHGEIWIIPGEQFDPVQPVGLADEYVTRGGESEELPVKPR